MATEIIHSLLIIFTIGLSFLFSKSYLGNYDLQLSAILFIALYLFKKVYRINDLYHLSEALVFTFVVTTIINTTGGLTSPYFFLLYFLLFSLSLFLEPIISIVTTLAIVVFFLFSIPEAQNIKDLMPIFSLAFLTPFAMFLGQEFIREKTLKRKLEDVASLEETEKKDTHMFLSLVLKNHLQNIIDASENYLGDHHLEEIKKNARRMEKLIEDYEQGLE